MNIAVRDAGVLELLIQAKADPDASDKARLQCIEAIRERLHSKCIWHLILSIQGIDR